MVTLSWSATFWWCRRMLIKVGSFFFFDSSKRVDPSKSSSTFCFKVLNLAILYVLYVLSGMGSAHLQASTCLAAFHVLLSEERWNSLLDAHQHCWILRGLLWTHLCLFRASASWVFFTQCKRLTTYALLLLHNSSPMLLVSIHVRYSCVTAYILN